MDTNFNQQPQKNRLGAFLKNISILKQVLEK